MQLRSQVRYESKMKLGEPDLTRWALKRARALLGDRDVELVHEKLSNSGFRDGEGMWVALRTSHFFCCKSCSLVRGDGIAFGSMVKDKAFCNSTNDPGRTSGREDNRNMYLLHKNQALLPPRWRGPQWPPSNISASLAFWYEIQEIAACLFLHKDAPDHRMCLLFC